MTVIPLARLYDGQQMEKSAKVYCTLSNMVLLAETKQMFISGKDSRPESSLSRYYG